MARELCYAGIYFAEALIALQYCDSIFQRRRTVSRVGLVLTAGYGGLFYLSSMDSVWINGAGFLFVNFCIMKLAYRCGARSAAFHAAILTCVMSGSEMAVLALLSVAFADFTQYEKNFLVLLLLGILSKLLYFLLTRVCIHVAKGKRIASGKDGSVELLLCVAPVGSSLAIVAMIYIGITGGLNETARIFVMVSSLLLLISNILVFVVHGYHRELNAQYLETRLALQKENADRAYYELLKEQYESQRVLIHDIRGHLHTLYDLAEEKELERIKDYVKEVADTPALQSRVRFCENPFLNLLLVRYSELCRRDRVLFQVKVQAKSVDFMEASDLTALFGNLLENAWEAARQSVEKIIDFTILTKFDQRITVVKLRNSCLQKPERDASGNLMTRKADKLRHGVGSRSISHVVAKYGGEWSQRYEESEFQTTVYLKYQE